MIIDIINGWSLVMFLGFMLVVFIVYVMWIVYFYLLLVFLGLKRVIIFNV